MMRTKPGLDLKRILAHSASSGDIFEALSIYYDYLQGLVPVDRISLARFNFDQKYMRIFAQVSKTGSERTNFSYDVPEALVGLMKEGNLPETYVINEPEKDPIGRKIVDFEKFSNWSLIILLIKDQAVVNRAIFFVADARKRFTESHSLLIKDSYDRYEWLFETAIQNYGNKSTDIRENDPVTDEHEFFRQVTRRLCGNLDLEIGALHCLQYISRFLPVTSITTGHFSQDTKADLTVVRWSGFFNFVGGFTIPWNLEKKGLLGKMALPRVLIANEPEKTPLLSDYVEVFGSDWSALTMVLYRDGLPFGFAVIAVEGRNRYNEKHLALFTMLHDPFSLALSNNIKHREIIQLKNIIEEEKKGLQEELQQSSADIIIGESSGLKSVMEKARLVAGQDSPVLISGETGAGKEIIANFIHWQSSRRDGPLIKVNCGAIPDTLIDSELFGHEKGAFTDAGSRETGRFERADRGTIFLDEIAELSLQAQIRMLRVLQNKVIERVGGTEAIPVDIRIIAATHRNLEEMVASGQFREDLWFRLNVFPIHIPPLRSRKEDIPTLMAHFIEKKFRELKLPNKPSLSPDAMERLNAYAWPGNVREMENVVERELIVSRSETLTFQHTIPRPPDDSSQDSIVSEEGVLKMDEVYTRYIKKVLAYTNGKINGPGGAAELMRIKPGTLRHRMDKLGIPYGWEKKKLS